MELIDTVTFLLGQRRYGRDNWEIMTARGVRQD
jgi:hypothetical protein